MPDDDNRYTLPVSAETDDEYPTRCSTCNRPIERLSVFPGDHCLDCHAAVTPMPTAGDVIRAWGGRPIKDTPHPERGAPS